jgi:hypothetical protein
VVIVVVAIVKDGGDLVVAIVSEGGNLKRRHCERSAAIQGLKLLLLFVFGWIATGFALAMTA